MKKILVTLFLVLTWTPLVWAAQSFETKALDPMIVQHDGRLKPVLTFSEEVVWIITGKKHLPERGPVDSALYLFLNPKRAYGMDIIPITYHPLLKTLGLSKEKKYYSLQTLQENPNFSPLLKQAEAKKAAGQKLNGTENKALETASRAAILQRLLSGDLLRILPPAKPHPTIWGSLAEIEMYGEATQKSVSALIQGLGESLDRDQAGFDRNAKELIQTLQGLAPSLYPTGPKVQMELFYDRSHLFQKAWFFYLIGFIFFLLPKTKGKIFPVLAWIGTGTGFLAQTAALTIRVVIAGRPPVSNMFESLIFLGWGLMVFAIIFAIVFRNRSLAAIGSLLGFLTLLISDLLPIDSNVGALVPVLRSNYWLTIHVLTIVTSYAAFTFAMGIGHYNLGVYIVAPRRTDIVKTTTLFLYRIIQLGIVFLAAGTILGGVWANESWGRFWGWDPKETWALISLIGYLIIVHGRAKGWLNDFGLAVSSLVGFLLILMTYYGVNFVLGQGLHSYGFSSGGTPYAMGFVIFELVFITIASVRYLKLSK